MYELTIDSVSKYYNEKPVLNGVYLNCKVGEIVGLLGRNGSGKSTLLQIIFGISSADFFHLKINDNVYKKGYESNALAYCPQEVFVPYNYIKVNKLIDLFCSAYRETVSNNVNIKPYLEYKFGTLSGGFKRFLQVFLTIYSEKQYIILDEPFSQISPILIEEIKKAINNLSKVKGFIITDHYYQHLLQISSRVILLHQHSNYIIRNFEDLALYGYISNLQYNSIKDIKE